MATYRKDGQTRPVTRVEVDEQSWDMRLTYRDENGIERVDAWPGGLPQREDVMTTPDWIAALPDDNLKARIARLQDSDDAADREMARVLRQELGARDKRVQLAAGHQDDAANEEGT